MKLRKIISIMIVIVGVGTASYPFISNYIYEHRAKSAVSSFTKKVNDTNKKLIDEKFLRADEYNKNLLNSGSVFTDPFDEKKDTLSKSYNELLNMNADGMMGYIEIPAISVTLPIYHTSNPDVLEKGAGHLQGSSLPTGGLGTHTVITAHTGLNRAKMFTDLTEMSVGDLFYITVLGKRMVYRVYDIKVIKPENIGILSIKSDRDYATLVTCTPYGINTHRLLVMGERTEIKADSETTKTKKYISRWQSDYLLAVLVGVVMALMLITVIKVIKRIRSR